MNGARPVVGIERCGPAVRRLELRHGTAGENRVSRRVVSRDLPRPRCGGSQAVRHMSNCAPPNSHRPLSDWKRSCLVPHAGRAGTIPGREMAACGFARSRHSHRHAWHCEAASGCPASGFPGSGCPASWIPESSCHFAQNLIRNGLIPV